MLAVLLLLIGVDAQAHLEEGDDERHIMVSMRMIGHQVLLNAGDSTSRVLPIKKVGESYKIKFESDFDFYPHQMNRIIDSIVHVTQIAKSFTYQVEQCGSEEVVHSYEMLNFDSLAVVPCGTRPLPKDCYTLYFNIIEEGDFHDKLLATDADQGATDSFSFSKWIFLMIPLIILLALYFMFKKRREDSVPGNPNLIPLGKYLFDKINMELIFQEAKTELTGKEAELLLLLHSRANTTVDRDVILAEVWKDEGDYIGRTLDVFISKLRKKLSADESVKILNIRGVGYKLVLG